MWLAGESRSSCTANLQTLQMLLWRLNSNIKVTSEDLLLEIELLSVNRSIAFNNHLNSTIGRVIKGFGGKQLNKHYYSTVGCFITVLAVLRLISTVVVL